MRYAIILVAALLVTSTASADQILAGVQLNIVFGETVQGVTGMQMWFDDTPVNFHPVFADVTTPLVYAGSEFPWQPAIGGQGLLFEFESAPGQVFDLTVPMAGLGAGGHDSNDCTTNLPDICGAHLQQIVDDPTYTHFQWTLNDFLHENVSLPNGINVRTTVGMSILFYGAPVPGPEPSSGLLLAVGSCAVLTIRRRQSHRQPAISFWLPSSLALLVP